ncbi:pilus assembly protein [Hoeflea sp. CAU 1731]
MKTAKALLLWRSFAKDERGNFAMIFAFAILAIFLSAGLAVDLARNLSEKTQINNALDAATLATARALAVGDIEKEDAESYLKSIFAANLGLDDLTAGQYEVVDVDIDDVNQEVTAIAKTDQNLTFMGTANRKNTQVVSADSAASYGMSDIEVAMVLDITGSMGGSKISALRNAAKLGVKELLAMNTDTDENVRISLIPYSDAVNAGYLAKYVFPDFWLPKTKAPVFNAALYAETGLGFDPYSFKETMSNGIDEDDVEEFYEAKRNGSAPDDCATDRKAPKGGGTSYQYSDANPSYGMISRDSRLQFCPASPLMLLTSNKSNLDARIDGLIASGHTAGHIGLQWAWYTISHDWANYVPEESRPAVIDEETAKYIILMTDGEFNTAFADITSDIEDVCEKYKKGKCREWGREIDFNHGNQGSTSRAHTGNLCDAIKDKKIKIFTIGFSMNNNTALNMLKDCASPDEGSFTYYYEPDTANELTETYETIARSIQSLRLVK